MPSPTEGTPAAPAREHAPVDPTGAAVENGGVLDVVGLSTGYRREAALVDVTFSVGRGELLAVIGPNGSGKSTLLKTLIGLLPAWSGSALVFGDSPERQRTRIGYMPQAEAVDWNFPVTVREVVAMGLYRPRWGPGRLRSLFDVRQPSVDAAMERTDITPLAARQVGELSGGQQRRVLLARTLVKEPDLLLLDEPASGLDVSAEHDLMELLATLAGAGKTVVVATHDLTSVYEFYSFVLCINRRVIAFGRPNDVLTEEALVETFGRHLLVFHRGEHGYTAEPHVHHGIHEHE